MAGAPPVTEEEPMKWFQPLIGLIVVLLALASFGIAIAGASDGDAGHDDDSSHVEDTDHSDDDDH